MLAMIKKSGALRRESSEVIEMVAKIAEANGFRADDDAFAECFAHSEFADWNFTHEGLVVESAHKAAIRKMIHAASRETKLQEVEEGEFQAPPEGKDQLQLLGEMLSKCSKKSANRETHVDTSRILRDECGNWGDTAHFLLPNSENTNAMAKDLEKLKEKGIATPFVYSNIAKFAPEWHSGSYTEGFLLPPAVLMPALLRWAMACQANKMISMHIGVTHADICMRVAEEARDRQKHNTTAAAYDEIIRKNLAEMSLKGVANSEPSIMLCTSDREIFEQACQQNGTQVQTQDRGIETQRFRRGPDRAWQGLRALEKPGIVETRFVESAGTKQEAARKILENVGKQQKGKILITR